MTQFGAAASLPAASVSPALSAWLSLSPNPKIKEVAATVTVPGASAYSANNPAVTKALPLGTRVLVVNHNATIAICDDPSNTSVQWRTALTNLTPDGTAPVANVPAATLAVAQATAIASPEGGAATHPVVHASPFAKVEAFFKEHEKPIFAAGALALLAGGAYYYFEVYSKGLGGLSAKPA